MCNNHTHDLATISSSRECFREQIANYFTDVLRTAIEIWLTRLGTVSLDGTKIKANARMHMALSWKRAQTLEAQRRAAPEELLAMAEHADKDTVLIGLDIPEELKRRKVRLAKTSAPQQEIQAQAKARHAQHETKMTMSVAKAVATGKKPRG